MFVSGRNEHVADVAYGTLLYFVGLECDDDQVCNCCILYLFIFMNRIKWVPLLYEVHDDNSVHYIEISKSYETV